MYAASAHAALRAGDRDGAQEIMIRRPEAPPDPLVCVPVDLGADPARTRARPGRALRRGGGSDAPRRGRARSSPIGPIWGPSCQQARELREHVGTIRSGRSPGPSTLTAAELRVLNLLPTYLSFREIGARLFVSPNTVKIAGDLDLPQARCLLAIRGGPDLPPAPAARALVGSASEADASEPPPAFIRSGRCARAGA